MGVRRQSAARCEFTAEVLQLLFRQSAQQERPRVNSGRSVSLEVNDVAFSSLTLPTEEMVETDFIQRRSRSIGRNMSADSFRVLVRTHHHCQRVPANEALDAALEF